MNINEQFYCSHCMRELEEETVCPHCGYDPEEMVPRHCLEEGTLFQDGKYQLGAVLGYGGFGITYAAWDYSLSRPVAIKEYYPNTICDRDSQTMDTVTIKEKEEDRFKKGMKRFLKEAKLMSTFENVKNVVSVLEFFEDNHTAYIVMEYVRGLTLGEYVRREKLTPQALIAKVRELIDTLILVHGQGVIHRDISPGNILVQEDGSLKLIDFGAAISGEQQKKGERKTEIYNRDFAPREQYEADTAQGPWTDVYALSATLYYLICGEVPNQKGKTSFKRKTGLKKWQEQAIMGGLVAQPEKRIQSMEIFRSVMYHLPMPEEVIRRRKFWMRATAAVVTASAFSILGTVNFTSGFYLGDGVRYSLRGDGWHITGSRGIQEELEIPERKLGIPVSQIEIGAFQGEEALTYVSVPGTVKWIGAFAFQNCENLRTVKMEEGIKSLGIQAFGNCEQLQAVSVPDSLVELEEDSFSSNASRLVLLGNLTAPAASLAAEYDLAFAQIETEENETGLTVRSYETGQKEARIPDEIQGRRITRLDAGAEKTAVFPSAVQTVVLPDYLEKIGDYAFYQVEVESIQLPDTVNEIGEAAFSQSFLKEVTLPESVTALGDSAFASCVRLEEVELSKNIEKVSNGCFETDIALKKVTLPDGITEIGKLAFSQCNALESVHLPEGMQRIGNEAFMDCRGLQRIYLPESLEYMNVSAISGCPNSLVFVGHTDTFTEKFAKKYQYSFYNMDDYEKGMLVTESGKLFVAEDIPASDVIALPTYYEERVVEQVARASDLKSRMVKLPERAVSTGVQSFYGNSYLEEVAFPDTLKQVETASFWKCDSLKEAVLPEGVEKIGKTAFADCSSLEKIVLPDSLELLEEGAFEGCRSLTEVKLPASLVLLEADTFAETGLTSVTIPGNINKCRTAFYGCKELKQAEIEDGVRTLWGTFAECENLETVVIPSSMDQISCSTFLGCSGLKDVWIYSDDVKLDAIWAGVQHVDYQKIDNGKLVFEKTSLEEFPEPHLFSDSPNLTIHGYRGSTAQSYALEYGIAFEVMEDLREQRAEELDLNPEKEVRMTEPMYSPSELAEKLTPKAGMGCDFFWSQFRYALGYQLSSCIKECLDAYEREGAEYDKLIAKKTRLFLEQGEELGYSAGEAICYFEDGKKHPTLQAGDLIVEVDGKKFGWNCDISKLKGMNESGSWIFTVLRENAPGELERKEVKVEEQDPLVATRNIAPKYFEEILN